MANIDNLTESFKFKYDRFLMGCDAVEEEGLWDKEKYGEMDGFYANDLVSVIIRIIAVDGSIRQSEADYLNKCFSFDYTVDELKDVYNDCSDVLVDKSFDENFENGISVMRKINPKLADAYKELLTLSCEIIIASDGVIGEGEIEEAKKLRALFN